MDPFRISGCLRFNLTHTLKHNSGEAISSSASAAPTRPNRIDPVPNVAGATEELHLPGSEMRPSPGRPRFSSCPYSSSAALFCRWPEASRPRKWAQPTGLCKKVINLTFLPESGGPTGATERKLWQQYHGTCLKGRTSMFLNAKPENCSRN